MPTTSAWDLALSRLGTKKIAATPLRTKEWATVPAQIRDRAFFSAGIQQASLLDEIQKSLLSVLAQDGTGPVQDRATFVADLRAKMGAVGDTNSLTDITSARRQQLIYDMQIQDAQEWARHKTQMEDPAILDAYPAQELVRVKRTRLQRDWEARWQAAGGTLIDGRMVALKTSPIWEKLSRFGKPYPPFDWGSGMGLEDIERDEAETLGLLKPGQQLDPAPVPALTAKVEAPVKDMDPAVLSALQKSLGPKLKVSNGTATLVA